MLTKRRSSPVSSRRRSLRPGYCASRPSMQATSVSPSPETTSWSLVSLRSGVGMRTMMLKRRLSCPGCTAHSGWRCMATVSYPPDSRLCRRRDRLSFNNILVHRVDAHALLLNPLKSAVDFISLSVDFEDHPASVVLNVGAADVGHDFEFTAELPDDRFFDQGLHEGELYATLFHDVKPLAPGAALRRAPQARDDNSSGRLREDPLGLGEELDSFDDFVIGDDRRRAVRFGHRFESVVAVGRVADRQRLRDRVRLLGLDEIAPPIPGLGDGRAAFGLGPAHSRGAPINETQPGELLDALVDLRIQGAARQRHDAVVRRAPAQLFAHFVAESLAAFRVIRAHVDVNECPWVLVADLATQPVDLVVAPVHRDERWTVDGRADDLALLQVGGDEDARLHARAGGVGRHAVGEVAGRG